MSITHNKISQPMSAVARSILPRTMIYSLLLILIPKFRKKLRLAEEVLENFGIVSLDSNTGSSLTDLLDEEKMKNKQVCSSKSIYLCKEFL